MKKGSVKVVIIVVALFLLSACGGENQSQENTAQTTLVKLSPLQKGDQRNLDLDYSLTAAALPDVNTNQQTVSFNQVIDEAFEENGSLQEFVKHSRSFKIAVESSHLARGVYIPVHSEAAVIRVVSPVNRAPLSGKNIKVKKRGEWLSGEKAFDIVADENTLKAYGLDATGAAFAARLKTDAGKDPFLLKASEAIVQPGTYMVHVLEPNSDAVLRLAVDKNRVLSGESLKLSVDLHRNAQKLALGEAEGYLLAPGASTKLPLALSIEDGEIRMDITTHKLMSDKPGLWEIGVATRHGTNENSVLRDAKIAFALAQRTARLSDEVRVTYTGANADLKMRFALETALPGRYELSGIIYGYDTQGLQKAGVQVSSAAWLNGIGFISFDVANDLLLEANISAPFELRDLRLKDQTRMSELWKQKNALTIN